MEDGYDKLFKKSLETEIFNYYRKFKDVKEELMTSFSIPGEEKEFKALALTHLVIQSKELHSVRTIVDNMTLNNFFSK